MKLLITLMGLAALFTGQVASAEVVGGSRFQKVVHLSGASSLTSTKSASNSGRDYASPKGFFDAALFAIPANVIIDNVYVIVDEAIVGPTAIAFGDTDAATGFITSSTPAANFAATGLHWWDLDYKGAYLKAGFVVTNNRAAKLYSATGKDFKLDITGTASAGKARVFVEGYAIGRSGL